MNIISNMNKTKDEKIYLQPSHVRVYRFIEKYIEKNVISPEVKEICKGVRVAGRHVYRILADLEKLGYIKRDNYRKRSIQIAKELG